MNKQEAVKIINKVGEDFGWLVGKISANYENGYMKAVRDCKSAIEYYANDNKVVTNADRIRSMTDEGLAQFLKDCSCYVTCTDCSEIDVKGKCTGDCAKPYLKWLKEKVE